MSVSINEQLHIGASYQHPGLAPDQQHLQTRLEKYDHYEKSVQTQKERFDTDPWGVDKETIIAGKLNVNPTQTLTDFIQGKEWENPFDNLAESLNNPPIAKVDPPAVDPVPAVIVEDNTDSDKTPVVLDAWDDPKEEVLTPAVEEPLVIAPEPEPVAEVTVKPEPNLVDSEPVTETARCRGPGSREKRVFRHRIHSR